MSGGKLNPLTGYREGNKHRLECPFCENELMSIGTYKQMERDRIKWAWIEPADRESHLLNLSHLGFCEHCGGFCTTLDFMRTPQEEKANKVFEEKIRRSVSQAKSNNLRKHLRLTRREDWRYRMRNGRKLDDGTPEPDYTDDEWFAWYRQYKKEELERAKTKQWVASVLDREENQ